MESLDKIKTGPVMLSALTVTGGDSAVHPLGSVTTRVNMPLVSMVIVLDAIPEGYQMAVPLNGAAESVMESLLQMTVSPGKICAFTTTSYTCALSIVVIPQEEILHANTPQSFTYLLNPFPDKGGSQVTVAFAGAEALNCTESPEQKSWEGITSRVGVL
jgi:hypothetical protein